MIDLSIFREGIFSLSVACVLIVFVATFCVNTVMPFYLQEALGLSPSQAGLLLLASPLGERPRRPLSGPFPTDWGKAPDRSRAPRPAGGPRRMGSFGLDTGPALVAVCLAAFGAGSGIFGSPNTKLIMSTRPGTSWASPGASTPSRATWAWCRA